MCRRFSVDALPATSTDFPDIASAAFWGVGRNGAENRGKVGASLEAVAKPITCTNPDPI